MFGIGPVSDREAARVELADYLTMRDALGDLGGGLDGAAWVQATLPMRLGGLGLTSCRRRFKGYQHHFEKVLDAIERRDAEAVRTLMSERRKECEADDLAARQRL